MPGGCVWEEREKGEPLKRSKTETCVKDLPGGLAADGEVNWRKANV